MKPPPPRSTLFPYTTLFRSSSAVDGNTDGTFFDGSVTHTNQDANAWWQVDLGTSATVASIERRSTRLYSSDGKNDYSVFVSKKTFVQTDTPTTLQGRAGTWS